jgi:3-oxoacyl-[acyl-carrier-protein] synthase II
LTMKRVVITGIGAVTPLATSFRNSWKMVKSGGSGIGLLTHVDPDTLIRKRSVLAAGEITDIKLDTIFSKKEINHMDPFISYAVLAALEAVQGSGLVSEERKTGYPCGFILGSSRGGVTTLEKEFIKISSGPGNGRAAQRVSPFLMPTTTISAASAYAGFKLGITGYMLGISSACASGANAIGEAFQMIRSGRASIMLAGGTEAPICRLCVEGYSSAGVMSSSEPAKASRPFDSGRDGFVLGEGACVLTLEEMGHALGRNATIHAEIVGYGNFCDPASLTLPSVRGEALAISKALGDAQVKSSEVDYINAHGTSTLAGDTAEAAALIKIFGKRPVPVNAIKSMTGHMLAASGAFEAACTAMSLKEGIIPPTINTHNIDPGCAINLGTEAMEIPLDVAISNSFGFGGVNTVLVFRRFKG